MRNLAKTNRSIVIFLSVLAILAGCAGHHQHRRPADIQEYLSHLDRPERDEYQQPAKVIEALGVEPGMAIADLGSGSGYFTRRFVQALAGDGTIYAIDVEQEMLDYVQASLKGHPAAATVQLRLANPDDPALPPASVDLVFICNVFHHLENRPAYLEKLKSALNPGGRIAIIDFHHDHRSGDVGFPRRHLVPRDTVLAELDQAGYHLLKEHDFLKRQYFLEFGLPTP